MKIFIISLFFLALFLPVLIKRPIVLWAFPLLGVAFGLPISLLVNQPRTLNAAMQICGVFGSIMLFLQSREQIIKNRLGKSILLLVYLCGLGILIGAERVPFIVALQGIKLLLLPLLLSLGAVNEHLDWKKLIKFAISIQLMEVLVACGQHLLGISKLLILGLTYGTQIRQIRGQLRAPALFNTHFEFGLYSAGIFAICLMLRNRSDLSAGSKWMNLGLISSIFGLVLSTARTAILIAATIFILKKIGEAKSISRINSTFLRLILLLTASSIFIRIMPNLFAAESFFSRFDNWREISKLFNLVFGDGIGIVGGATNSTYASPASRVVVDNYVISLLSQIGFAGLIIFAYSLLRLTPTGYREKQIIYALLISFTTLETWEYYVGVSILLITQIKLYLSDSKEQS